MNVETLFLKLCFALLVAVNQVVLVQAYTPPVPPKISPATGLENQLYKWRNQQIRYQQAGPKTGEPVVLIHGLFVNCDHWRKPLLNLAENGYCVYALDLFGYGYSSKPPYDSPEAQAVNGENGRFNNDDNPGVLTNVKLGTADGKGVRVRNVDLRHPLNSPYNFFTWSELITDFSREIVRKKGVTLVSNSIGTISALQAVIDTPDQYSGVCVVTPNFRELHSAEIAAPQISMPIVRLIQSNLRERGQGLFDALAIPKTVKQILKEPYKVDEAIDDVLVQVLLDPLLTEGASKVVFDTLSYSAGPLPEQQLDDFPRDKPVWICYGLDDPWTPSARVEAMINKDVVERVVGWKGIGHCPHDEAPELVDPFVLAFLERLGKNKKTIAKPKGLFGIFQ